jgi:RNA polymerase sigma factor (sigma-70 family)
MGAKSKVYRLRRNANNYRRKHAAILPASTFVYWQTSFTRERTPQRKTTIQRLASLSDAVFAVIITIMVLELRPPENPTFAALSSLWPTALSFSVKRMLVSPALLRDWRQLPSDIIEREEIRKVLQQAVETLPHTDKQVFLLRDVEKISVNDTAQTMHISISLVKVRLHRARMMLQRLLAPN